MGESVKMLQAILNYADAIVVSKGELVERKASLVLNALETVIKEMKTLRVMG